MLHIWTLLVVLILALISKGVYNVLFHPLRHYPGPKLAAASRLWYSFKVFGGHHKYAIKKLHDKYGDVVRIAPNELSYIDPRAWEDIYGKSAHEKEAGGLEKDAAFFAASFDIDGADSVVGSNSREFKPQKNTANRAFSHASLVSRNHIMSSYIDRSIEALRDYLCNRQESAIDINPWLGNMVLDIHSKLTISQDFGAVNLGPIQHSVVTHMHKAVTVMQYCTQLQHLPRILTCLPGLIPKSDMFSVLGNIPPLGPAISNRLASTDKQEDFATHMMGVGDGDADDISAARRNCLIFILSGVETLPGYMCSILYYLLATPEYFARASSEVRSQFERKEDITTSSAQTLQYLRACMREGLRVSPPFVGTLSRVIPRNGALVCGQLVPAGTIVGIHNWSITHNEGSWKDADNFRPERWLGDAEYAGDQREVFKPFGSGPRTCVAQHLVLLEPTLILAKLLFDFDMTLDQATCGEWPVHVGSFVPTRGSLIVNVKARTRNESTLSSKQS